MPTLANPTLANPILANPSLSNCHFGIANVETCDHLDVEKKYHYVTEYVTEKMTKEICCVLVLIFSVVVF